MTKKLIIQLLTITTLSACSTTIPAWVDNGSLTQYPEPKYVSAVGCSTTDPEAEKVALSALARRIEVTVTNNTSRDTVAINNFMKTTSTRSIDTNSEIQLDGAFTAKTWHSQKETCVLEVIDRNKALLTSKLDIEQAMKQLKTINYNKDPLKALKLALLEQQLSKKAHAAEATENALNPASRIFHHLDTTKEDKKALYIIKHSTFSVETNDHPLGVYVMEKLQEMGLHATVKDPKFIVEINTEKRLTGSAFDNYIHVFYTAEIRLERPDGRLYKKKDRSNRVDDTSVQYIYEDANQDIEKNLIDKFCEKILM
jgi:hypothetical protein